MIKFFGMVSFIHKYKLTLTGVILGMTGGFLYYHFIGCASGSCLITSRPLNSTLYGGLMGGLLFQVFQKEKNKSK